MLCPTYIPMVLWSTSGGLTGGQTSAYRRPITSSPQRYIASFTDPDSPTFDVSSSSPAWSSADMEQVDETLIIIDVQISLHADSFTHIIKLYVVSINI